MDEPQKKTVKEFALSIKEKYPEYKDMDDLDLAKRIVDKYPQYKDVVYFEDTPVPMAAEAVENVEKKSPNQTEIPGGGTENVQSPSGSSTSGLAPGASEPLEFKEQPNTTATPIADQPGAGGANIPSEEFPMEYEFGPKRFIGKGLEGAEDAYEAAEAAKDRLTEDQIKGYQELLNTDSSIQLFSPESNREEQKARSILEIEAAKENEDIVREDKRINQSLLNAGKRIAEMERELRKIDPEQEPDRFKAYQDLIDADREFVEKDAMAQRENLLTRKKAFNELLFDIGNDRQGSIEAGLKSVINEVTAIPRYAGQLIQTAVPLVAKSMNNPAGELAVNKISEDAYDFLSSISEASSFDIDQSDDRKISRFIGSSVGQLGAAVASGGAGALFLGYTMTADEMYRDAIASGISREDAKELATIFGSMAGPLNMIPIGRIQKTMGKPLRDRIIKEISKETLEGIGSNLAKRKVAAASIKNLLKNYSKEVGLNSMEEGVQEGIEFVLSDQVKRMYNASKDGKPLEGEFELPEVLKDGERSVAGFIKSDYAKELGMNIGLGTAAGGIIGSISTVLSGRAGASEYSAIKNMMQSDREFRMIKDQVDAQVKAGDITEEDGKRVSERLDIVRETFGKVRNNWSPEVQQRVLPLMWSKKQLENELEEVDETARASIEKEIEGVNNSINRILKENNIPVAQEEGADQTTEGGQSTSEVDTTPAEEITTEPAQEEDTSQEVNEEVTETITDEQYQEFSENDNVPDEVISSITTKLQNEEPLSERETEIYNSREEQINSLTDDSQNQERVSGEVNGRQEPEQRQPEQSRSETQAEPDRVLQEGQTEEVATPYTKGQEINIKDADTGRLGSGSIESINEDGTYNVRVGNVVYKNIPSTQVSPVPEATVKDINKIIPKEAFESVVTKSVDDGIKWLDDIDKKLSDFGKETLGMNLPVSVAQLVVKAAKAGLQATRTASGAIDQAVEALRNSDWYKSLGDDQKSEADNSVRSIFISSPVPESTSGSEKAVEKPKAAPKRGQRYKQRVLDDLNNKKDPKNLSEAIERTGTSYEPVYWKRVAPVAQEIVSDALATDNVNETLDAIRASIQKTTNEDYANNADLSTLHSILYHKIIAHYREQNNASKFADWINDYAVQGRYKGRFIAAMADASTKEAVANRAVRAMIESRTEALSKLGESGKSLKSEIDELKTSLKLKESEIDQLSKIIATMNRGELMPDMESEGPKSKNFLSKRKRGKEQIRKALRKQRGQLSAGGPLNLIADKDLLRGVRLLIESYIDEGVYNVKKIQQSLSKDLVDENELLNEIKNKWDQIFDENLSSKSREKQADKFIEVLTNRGKANLKSKRGRELTPEEILLNSLKLKVDETTGTQKDKPKRTDIQKIREAIINRDFSDDVWKSAMANVEMWLNEQPISDGVKSTLIAKLQDSVAQFMDNPFPEYVLRRALKDGSKDLGQEIDKIVRKHYTVQNKSMKTLEQKLIEELGLDAQSAKRYQDRISREVESIYEETRQKEIRKFLDLGPDNKPKTKAQKVNKRIVDKISEGINLGLLSDSDFQNYFSEKFNFTALSSRDIQHLMRLNDLIYEHEGSSLSQMYMKDLMDYIEGLKRWDAEKFYQTSQSLIIRGLLTGISTMMINIPVGSFLAYMTNTIPRFFANPNAYIQAVKAFKKTGMAGMGRQSFLEVMTTNNDTFDNVAGSATRAIGETQKELRGDYIDYIINNSQVVERKFKDAKTKKQKLGAFLSLAGRSWLKLYQLANFARAFDLIISRRGTEIEYFIDEYRRTSEEAGYVGAKGFFSKFGLANMKKINEAVTKKVGYDPETLEEVDRQVQERIAKLKAKGERVPIGFEKTEKQHLLNEMRDQEQLDRAKRWVKTSLLMEAPEGITGWAFNGLNKLWSVRPGDSWGTGFAKTFSKMAFGLFLRISVSAFQRSVEAVPLVGLTLPGVFYDYKRVKDENGKEVFKWKKQTAKRRNERIALNAASTALISWALYDMFEYDDEENPWKPTGLNPNRTVDIVGGGAGKPWENEQIKVFDEKREDYSLYLNFGSDFTMKIPSRLMPWMIPVAGIVGSVRDRVIYDQDSFMGEKAWDTLLTSSLDMFGAFTSQSFNTIPRRISEFYRAGVQGDAPGVIGEAASQTTELLKAAVYPRLPGDIYNEIEGWLKKEKKTGEYPFNLFKGVPVLEDMTMDVSHDVFGYPKKKTSVLLTQLSDAPLGVGYYVDNFMEYFKINEDRYRRKAWELKTKYRPDEVIKGYWPRDYEEDGVKVKVNREMKEFASKIYGEQMRGFWEDPSNENDIKNLNDQDFNVLLNSWHRISQSEAKYQMRKRMELESE